MPLLRGTTPITAIYRGVTPVKAIYRGSVPVWTLGAGVAHIWEPFDCSETEPLPVWIKEGVDDIQFFSDGGVGIIDDLDEMVGRIVGYAPDVGPLGTLVSNAATDLVDAYCGAWGGTAPPGGLVGLVNGIPIIGGSLADWLEGGNPLDSITSLIGEIPLVDELAAMIGLVPNSAGDLLDPLNFVTDAAGEVIGIVSCGAYEPSGSGPFEIAFPIGCDSGSARPLVPDGLVSLQKKNALARHPTLLPDDGFLQVRISALGAPDYITQAFRRYSNDGSMAEGVGIDIRNSSVSIVHRSGGNDTLVEPNLASVSAGSVLRLNQAGNLHTLFRDGQAVGQWDDDTATASSGVGFQSVGLRMEGGKELLGPRRFSASLDHVMAG